VKSISIHKSGVNITFDSIILPEVGSIEPVIGSIVAPEKHAELEQLKYDEHIEQIKALDPMKYEQLLADGAIEDIYDEQESS
jgi:hypothetical protein